MKHFYHYFQYARTDGQLSFFRAIAWSAREMYWDRFPDAFDRFWNKHYPDTE